MLAFSKFLGREASRFVSRVKSGQYRSSSTGSAKDKICLPTDLVIFQRVGNKTTTTRPLLI